jgi:DNA-directed RNA polymerase subunit L
MNKMKRKSLLQKYRFLLQQMHKYTCGRTTRMNNPIMYITLTTGCVKKKKLSQQVNSDHDQFKDLHTKIYRKWKKKLSTK